MAGNDMTPQMEQALIEDVKSLASSSGEMKTSIALIQQELMAIKSTLESFNGLATEEQLNEVKQEQILLEQRLALLEQDKVRRDARDEIKKERVQWWSNNWYKVVGVIAVLIPVIATTYNIIKAAQK